jgi:type IV secretory pathway VirB2 component (pilin)
MTLLFQLAGSLADPPDSSAIVPAVEWVQNTLLGTVAVSAAAMAVAAVGFLMLSGRIEARRGLVTIVGCFILFGAPAIARGLRSMVIDRDGTEMIEVAPAPPIAVPRSPSKPNVFDPYAGAALQQ